MLFRVDSVKTSAMKPTVMAQSVSTREDFLKNRWSRYPEKPAHHTVAGRIVAVDEEKIELCLSPGVIHNYSVSDFWREILRRGDWISLDPVASELCLLAPCLATLQQPWVSEPQLNTLARWSEFQNLVREFFVEQGFAEVQTPTLTVCPGTEPFLDVFETQFQMGQMGKVRQKYFLPTSPELHLKKALARGIPRLFEMRPCFRNGEVSSTHQPEFWMLEWYRSFENLAAIKADVENLVGFLIRKMKLNREFTKPKHRSLAQLFLQHCDFSLTPSTSGEELHELCQRLRIETGSAWDFDDLFFFLFLEKIEPRLGGEGPLFVENYPPSQAALARLTTEGWGDRFEFYWQGLEIANAFHELNDPVIQRQRFEQDLAKKAELGKPSVPLDLDFLESLETGLPPSAGIALGLERLFMVLMDRQDISELRLFPIAAEPEKLF
jgi:lysyl-tRNA synthetase class 2